METPVLLIDGNNLAHFLYTNLLPGQKLTAEDSRRLIGHLSSYARNNAGEVEVELCFDRSPGLLPDLPGGLRVFSAAHPNDGDALLLERFAYHCYDRRPCLVITNDEDVREEVRRLGGASIKAADFVRRAGAAKPVFRDPDDLPPIPVPPELPQEPAGSERHQPQITPVPASQKQKRASRQPAPPESNLPRGGGKNGRSARNGSTASGPLNGAAPLNGPLSSGPRLREPLRNSPDSPSQTTQPAASPPGGAVADQPAHSAAFTHINQAGELTGSLESSVSSPGEHAPNTGTPQRPAAPPSAGLTYHLTLESWPTREGARFLQDAFCPAHRAQLHELIEAVEPETAQPADLRELAGLLVEHCGAEVDFGRKGALMTRVRLALLRAPGQTLTIDQLAEQTGFKLTGLQGRIKEKSGNWIRIDYGNLHA